MILTYLLKEKINRNKKYYAILLIIEKYIVKEHYVKFLNRFITLFLILIGWVIFRIEDFSQLCVVFKGMFGIYNVDSTVQIPGLIEYISEHSDVFSKVIFIIPAIIGSMPVYNKIFSKSKESNTVLIIEYLCIFILFLISICLLEASTYNPFIYFRF